MSCCEVKRLVRATACTAGAGLTLAYGLIVLIGGTVDLAGAAGGGHASNNWGGETGVFPPILLLLAQLTVTTFGLVSVVLGFQVGFVFFLKPVHVRPIVVLLSAQRGEWPNALIPLRQRSCRAVGPTSC